MIFRFFTVYFILHSYFAVWAQKTFHIDHLNHDTILFAPNAAYLLDSEQNITAQNLLSTRRNFVDFVPGTCSSPDQNSYWLKVPISNGSAKPYVLEFLDPHIYQITAYAEYKGKLVALDKTQGYGLDFTNKKYQYKNFIFDIATDTKDSINYYFHFKTHLVNCFIFKVRPVHTTLNYALTEYSILSFYYGVLFLMALYNFILFYVYESGCICIM